MRPHPQESADLVIFTEEILNGTFQSFVQWSERYIHPLAHFIPVAPFSTP